MATYILRHGQTHWNQKKIKQGQSDSSLTNLGKQQAVTAGQIIAKYLANTSTYQVFVSPLGRTVQYSKEFFRAFNPTNPIIYEPLLMEHHFGSWEGLTSQEIDYRFPGEQQKREQNKWKYVIEGGESYEKIYTRASIFLERYKDYPNKIIITHEMISKVIRGLIFNMDPNEIIGLSHSNNEIFMCDTTCQKSIPILNESSFN